MISENRCEALARQIRNFFQNSLSLDDNARHFITTTYSSLTPEELAQLLHDPAGNDAEPLMELLFFPDIKIQESLETFLEAEAFEEGDEDTVLSFLSETPLRARLVLTEHGKTIDFPVPEWAAAQFVARLKITRKVDARLIEAIRTHVPEPLRLHFKVRMRHSRFIPSDKNIMFLCNFFERIQAEPDDMTGMLAFLTGFLDEIRPDAHIFNALMDYKKRCFRALQQAAQFEKQMQRDNMETLMLQGVRIPHIDPQETRRTMTFIDRISRAVFGRTEQLDPFRSGSDMGHYNTGDLDSLIDHLA